MDLNTPARWEERSVSRVVETGRDHLLERSRCIVGAAYDLLKEDGLEGITIRAVLKKTGLSRRAFYERFAGKDDLMLAVFEETIRLAADHYAGLIPHMDDPLDRLELIVTSIVLGRRTPDADGGDSADRRGVAMSREHMRLAESHPEDLQTALAPLIAIIAQQLSDGIARGLVRRADPQRLATLVYNLVATTVHTELLSHQAAVPDLAHRSQLAADIWEFCRRAVVA